MIPITTITILHSSICIQRSEHLWKNTIWNVKQTPSWRSREWGSEHCCPLQKEAKAVDRGENGQCIPHLAHWLPHSSVVPTEHQSLPIILKVLPSRCDLPGFFNANLYQGNVTWMCIYFSWVCHQLSWVLTLFIISHLTHLSNSGMLILPIQIQFAQFPLNKVNHGYVTGACGYQRKHSQE